MINYFLKLRRNLKYKVHRRFLAEISEIGNEFCSSPNYTSPEEALMQFKVKVRSGSRKCLKIGDYCNLACSIFINDKGRLSVGDYVFMNGVTIRVDHHMQIGNHCLFGPGVKLWDTNNHPLSISERRAQCEHIASEGFVDSYVAGGGDIVIGDDVWIGMDALILGPVRIGAGAVVAARSVVTQDVPPRTLVAGIPASPIREIPN